MADDRKREQVLPEPPRLPERAAIYIAVDGTVQFGALFEGLLPVARALGGSAAEDPVASSIDKGGPPPPLEVIRSRGSDVPLPRPPGDDSAKVAGRG